MTARVIISPVARRGHADALRFLAGGSARHADVSDRAEHLRQLTEQYGPDRVSLWWALRKLRCVGAAMVIERAGRTGMLFHTPAAAEGVDAAYASQLIRQISTDALSRGMSLVQALKLPTAKGDIQMLTNGGYELLAKLLYMRLDLQAAAPVRHDESVTWRSYGQYSQEELAEVIHRTYAGSLDCPALSGLREMSDVIDGHKASGVFCPQAWWILYRDGHPAGCILVNDSDDRVNTEVVYMGAVPAQRGRGLSGLMLRRVAIEARDRGRIALRLSVDANNRYALATYRSEGFIQDSVRLAYVMKQSIRPASDGQGT